MILEKLLFENYSNLLARSFNWNPNWRVCLKPHQKQRCMTVRWVFGICLCWDNYELRNTLQTVLQFSCCPFCSNDPGVSLIRIPFFIGNTQYATSTSTHNKYLLYACKWLFMQHGWTVTFLTATLLGLDFHLGGVFASHKYGSDVT